MRMLCATSSRSGARLFKRQKTVVVHYKDLQIEGQRLDLLIGGMVITEIKAVDAVHPIHQARLVPTSKPPVRGRAMS